MPAGPASWRLTRRFCKLTLQLQDVPDPTVSFTSPQSRVTESLALLSSRSRVHSLIISLTSSVWRVLPHERSVQEALPHQLAHTVLTRLAVLITQASRLKQGRVTGTTADFPTASQAILWLLLFDIISHGLA